MSQSVSPSSQISISARADILATALGACLKEAPSDLPAVLRDRLKTSLQTLEREEIHIAVAGLFKAGKSTLINRLAGWNILPTGSLPETGAPALLRSCSPASVRVKYRGRDLLSINPASEVISSYSSLYTDDGSRKPLDQIAEWVEIDAPRLKLAKRIVIIDLPGLRDTADMDEIALEYALQADIILWVFRSEPAFSEQDTAFLDFLLSVCGPHVLQLVLNAFATDEDPKNWRVRRKTSLNAQRESLYRSASILDIPAAVVDKMLIVDARRFKRSFWGAGNGARDIDRFLKSVGKLSSEKVKRSRFTRIAKSVEHTQAWLMEPLEEAEQNYRQASDAYAVYSTRLTHRDSLMSQLNGLVERAFFGLDEEIKEAASSAARRARADTFEPGKIISGPLIEQATLSVCSRASALAANCIALAQDEEFVGLPTNASEQICEMFAIDNASGEPFQRVADSINAAVQTVRFDQPELSWGRIGSWFKGKDSEVESSRTRAEVSLNRQAKSLSESVQQRRHAVSNLVRSLLKLRPVEEVAMPDRSRLSSLEQFHGNLRTAIDLVTDQQS